MKEKELKMEKEEIYFLEDVTDELKCHEKIAFFI